MKAFAWMAVVILMGPGAALAYDCSDWDQWDSLKRYEMAKRRVEYFKFNPSWFKNVPTPYSVERSTTDLCKMSDMKSKNLDDLFAYAAEMNGMTK